MLTSSSALSERTRSWQPFLTASSAASQILFSVFANEPSSPFRMSKNVVGDERKFAGSKVLMFSAIHFP
ncbi:hypothetical protein Hanom_Chr01g00033701 [Helianthus anomalus]